MMEKNVSADGAFEAFIAALPVERQAAARRVWAMVRAAVPAGYTEHIGPKYLEFRAGTEMCLALANQKNYFSLHLVPMYVLPKLREQLAAAAPGLKMGKGCINFKQAEELPLGALAAVIGATPLAEYLAALPRKRA